VAYCKPVEELRDYERGHGIKGSPGTTGYSKHDSELMQAPAEPEARHINWPHVMDCWRWMRRIGKKKAGDRHD
jgi:hypothetical protein